MKLQHKNFFTRKKIIIAILVIVLISSGGAYAFFVTRPSSVSQATKPQSAAQNDNSKTNTKPATPQQVQAGENQKQDIINKDQTTPVTPANLNVTITAATQNGSTISVRTLISSISNSGSCSLTITNGASTITRSSTTQALADSSTCKGFDIPASSLPTGTWHIVVAVTVNSLSGSVQKDIVVN